MSDTTNKELWEVLVPTVHNDGKPIRTRFHRVWDTQVCHITGGLTVLAPAKGKWAPTVDGVLEERMIPVRIACTRKQINEIVNMTIKYYNQKAVLAYRISDKVILRYAQQNNETQTPT